MVIGLDSEYKSHAQLYQAYFDNVYQDLNPYQAFSKNEFKKLQQENICATYGELEYFSAIQLFKIATINEEDIFLDLGSGNGKLVFQAFLQTPAKLCLGIEAVKGLVKQAKRVQSKLLNDIPDLNLDKNHQIQFKLDNFLNCDWQGATIVYTCSTCYTKSLLIAIGNKINETHSVQKVFSLRPLPTLTRLKLKRVFSVECSWDTALCFYYSL